MTVSDLLAYLLARAQERNTLLHLFSMLAMFGYAIPDPTAQVIVTAVVGVAQLIGALIPNGTVGKA